ncbi:antibiotic biosynthesis monooxygenase [Micromonospora yasonensis]|uniref:putative quinol monooxygenase n=1 Tax=Micromonospora yasonensis TaxID=1128667 RepID=UPI0022312132|nr:putative quinol monooxygenase [Micromonospora yasonensis]MCW3838491.1 antibiotic biosynthesis monooxygenase [Micromonospora yasonensis]
MIAGPGRADAVRDALLRLTQATQEEGGNLSYDVHQLKNNPAAFYVLGNWADEQALDAHLASTHVRQCLTETVAGEIVAPYTQWRMQMLSEPDARLDRPRPVASSPAQVTLVPFFTIKAGEEAAVGKCHLEMVAISRAEPGCLGYDLYQSVEEPSVMFLYENWTDQAALDNHMNTSSFYRIVRGEIDKRLVAPWTAHMMMMISEPHREPITA